MELDADAFDVCPEGFQGNVKLIRHLLIDIARSEMLQSILPSPILRLVSQSGVVGSPLAPHSILWPRWGRTSVVFGYLDEITA